MSASTIAPILKTVASGEALTEDDMRRAISEMTDGAASPAQMAAFLMGLAVRGETVSEIAGAARLLREKMTPLDTTEDAIDIVGTGGDGHQTYNVSTCAAFVAAGAGLKVAKHGNRSVSSRSGASDVLTALGVNVDAPLDVVRTALSKIGVAFLWAPKHHPAMKTWAPIRAELGVRTVFNLLGPLCNPAGVKRHVIGVFDKQWVEPVADVLKSLGSTHAWVVHGMDGMDELTTTSRTTVAELRDGTVTVFDVAPEDAGLAPATLGDLKGGDAEENAKALRAVLAGEQSAYRDIVCLNAAAALVISDRAANLADGVKRAETAIDTGRAAKALDDLIAITTGGAP